MSEDASLGDISREETIFNAAVHLQDPAQRAIYLDMACANDPQLRARIDNLLGADERETLLVKPLLKQSAKYGAPAPPARSVLAEGDSQALGTHVGRSKL